MHKRHFMIPIFGLIVIIAGIIGMYFVLKGPSPYSPLILDAISVRSVGNDSIAKAKIIDDMDKNMGNIHDKETLDKWDELTNCLDSGCSDDLLFDFILSIAIAHPDGVKNSKLIADIIVVDRFWGGNDVLKFSKALSASNDAIDVINLKDINKKWDQIIACNGSCPEKNSLVFDIIKTIMEKESQK